MWMIWTTDRESSEEWALYAQSPVEYVNNYPTLYTLLISTDTLVIADRHDRTNADKHDIYIWWRF